MTASVRILNHEARLQPGDTILEVGCGTGALNRWLAYVKAMARMRSHLERDAGSKVAYGAEVPAFGRAPCEAASLVPEDIVLTAGKYGDGSASAGFALGELELLAEGAP